MSFPQHTNEDGDQTMSSPSSDGDDRRPNTDGLDDLEAISRDFDVEGRSSSEDRTYAASDSQTRGQATVDRSHVETADPDYARSEGPNKSTTADSDTQAPVQYFNSIEQALAGEERVGISSPNDDLEQVKTDQIRWKDKILDAIKVPSRDQSMVEDVSDELWKELWKDIDNKLVKEMEDLGEKEVDRRAWLILVSPPFCPH